VGQTNAAKCLIFRKNQAARLPGARHQGDRTESIIAVDQLVKRYRTVEVNAVADVSFMVSAGEFFALR
jgi:ABC-type glutathione transport system ATPase component